MEDGSVLPVLAASRLGYANLCSLLTQAHLRSNVKGECAVKWDELPEFAQGLIVVLSERGQRRLAACSFRQLAENIFRLY